MSFSRLVLAGLLMVAVAPPVMAQQQTQTPPTRPYRGLFGAPRPPADQQLALNVSLGGGFDNNVLLGDDVLGTGQAPVLTGRSSVTGFANVSLNYSKSGDVLNLNASGTTASSYYPDIDRPLSYRHSGNVSASVNVSERSQLYFGQTLTYQPYYSFLPGIGNPGNTPTVGDLAPPPDPGTQTQITARVTSLSSVAFRRQWTRRISFSTDYGYSQSGSGLSAFGLRTHQVGARVVYGIGRGLGVRMGYRYVESRFPQATTAQYRNHAADFGLNFNRGIQLGRSTVLNFGAGLATLQNKDSRTYNVRGNVSLLHEIGLTWTAALDYGRDVRYLDVLQAPTMADALFASVGGLIGRRVSLRMSGGASTGLVGVLQDVQREDRYWNYFGAVGVTVGLTRNIGVATTYSYFRYRFGGNIVLPAGVPRQTNRQGIRVTLQISPLFSWTPR